MRQSLAPTRVLTARSTVLPPPILGRHGQHTVYQSGASQSTWKSLLHVPRPARPAAASTASSVDNKALGENEVDEEDEEETPPPPLPATALEVLSDLLTGLASSSTDLEDGAARTSMRFCVNCCRPLPAPAIGEDPKACRACGHHPSRDAEILGDPNAWVAAYVEQLQRQQREQSGLQGAGQECQQAHAQGRQTSRGAAQAGDVLLVSDSRMLLHRSSLPPYPGRPERLQAIMSHLHSAGLMARCRLLACRPATEPELLAVHSRELVDAVRAMGAAAAAARQEPTTGGKLDHHDGACECGGGAAGAAAGAAGGPEAAASGASASRCCSSLCPDTLYNAHTGTAALLAAGAAAEVGAALASGAARGALAVVRPPGAQAGVDQARGGCYLNNVAVAAAAALGAGARRVLVVDWDVHHGRGTAEIFADDPRVMLVDLHRYDRDIYPGSGAVEEVGEGAGEGKTLNLAYASPGLSDGDLLSACMHVLLPVAHQFRPDVVLVAAGFGALRGDPIGGCDCSPAVFAHLTHQLAGVAPGGVGLLLEGGYNLAATAAAAEGCLRVLLGEAPPPLPGPWATTRAGWVGIMNAMQIHSQYWSSLHPLSFNGWVAAVNEQQRQLQEAEQAEALAAQHQAEYGPPSGSFDEPGTASAAGLATALGLGDGELGAGGGGSSSSDGDAEAQLQELLDAAASALQRPRGGGDDGPAVDEPDPSEVLDFILGTGGHGGSGSRGAGGHSVASLSVGDEGDDEGGPLGGDARSSGVKGA